ncbi:MAG TPA: non-canonical purine NTP pyrophosphatase [Candidatus Binataceae bacterium]|nr:non-canonical purine NTP pyrophosphatase [Candidatus Binataceae bacterium]
MRLLIATTNPAKLSEYRILLRDHPLEIVSLKEVQIAQSPNETGATFAENALLKARFYFERSGIPTLADDGGLEVDALGGAPGVKSHRWLGDGEDVSDRALAEEVIRRMEGVAKRRRTARLRAALALVYESDGKRNEAVSEAAIEGIIAMRAYPEIRPGFPYRAVLWLEDRGCYLGELGDEEEARISQRRVALEKLIPDLHRMAKTA